MPAYASEPIRRLARHGYCDSATLRRRQFYELVLRSCSASRVERPVVLACLLQALPEVARSTNIGNCANLLGKSDSRDFMLQLTIGKRLALKLRGANPASNAQRYRTVQMTFVKTSDPNFSDFAPNKLWAVVNVDIVELATFCV